MANDKNREFVEPELIKCEKRLDEVTMCYGQYKEGCKPRGSKPNISFNPGRPV